ncbi:hypothetical protein ACPVPU_08040 [Sphingomonas sp. CJ99]
MPGALTSIGNAAPAIAMLAVFALVIGALVLFRRGGNRRQPVLMLVLAAILLANVLILTL